MPHYLAPRTGTQQPGRRSVKSPASLQALFRDWHHHKVGTPDLAALRHRCLLTSIGATGNTLGFYYHAPTVPVMDGGTPDPTTRLGLGINREKSDLTPGACVRPHRNGLPPPSKHLSSPTRHPGLPGDTGHALRTPRPTDPLLRQEPVQDRCPPALETGSTEYRSGGGPPMVADPGHPRDGSSHGPICAPDYAILGRQQRTLGCSLRGLPSVGNMDDTGEGAIDQRARTPSGDPRPTDRTPPLARETNPRSFGQHLHGGVHQPPRRHALHDPHGSDLRSVRGSTRIGVHRTGTPHPRPTEQDGRPPVQISPDRQHSGPYTTR